MIKIILVSVICSALVSLAIMKFQMRMIEKWMDSFFEKEQDFIRQQLQITELLKNRR